MKLAQWRKGRNLEKNVTLASKNAFQSYSAGDHVMTEHNPALPSISFSKEERNSVVVQL